MSGAPVTTSIRIIGVGNTLLQDDGIGVHVTESFARARDDGLASLNENVEAIDAGTIGLALLPAVEAADALIVVDAAELGEAPGHLRIFRDREIDRYLSGARRSVHEVALVDLLAAAALRGHTPARRALVAIQPGCTDWGCEPTPEVRAAIPAACEAIVTIIDGWRSDEQQHA